MELTPLEQRIIANIREGDLITIDTLYRLGDLLKLADKKTIKEVAFNLVKKGVMIRIKRGKYLAVKSPEDYDPLKIANYLFDGYIAITTALFIYGYNQTKSFVIFGTTTSRKRSTKIGEYLYIAIPMGKLTFGSTYYRGYKVSTKAKTLLDCIYNMHYIADFVRVYAIFCCTKLATYEIPQAKNCMRQLTHCQNSTILLMDLQHIMQFFHISSEKTKIV